MPEGHTIHRLARDQTKDLAGSKVRVWSPQGRFSDSAALLDGRTVERVDAYGKHLFHRFDDGQLLHVHLGLIGKFKRQAAPIGDPVGLVRLRLEGPTAAWDLSGPMICRIVTPDEQRATIATLGPDPLRRGADRRRFIDKVQRSKKEIGALLLDQSVIAGVGNVFRAEVLFVQGIDPRTPGNQLTTEQLSAIWDELVVFLREGVRRNRIVTLRPEDRPRSLAGVPREEVVYVYHQERCRRCGGAIMPIEVAGRRIDVCPTCQR